MVQETLVVKLEHLRKIMKCARERSEDNRLMYVWEEDLKVVEEVIDLLKKDDPAGIVKA